nr:MAG TPA: hypothetical protein [Caudoviricetes sp.]
MASLIRSLLCKPLHTLVVKMKASSFVYRDR